MIEILVKIGAYAAAAFLLISLNLWFIKFTYEGFVGGEISIEPFKVYEMDGSLKQNDDNLAAMLISQIESLEIQLSQSQTELKDTDEVSSRPGYTPKNKLIGAIGSVGDFPLPKVARLNTRLFSPAQFDAKISGVDVGAILPSIQRWFVQDRILKFSLVRGEGGKGVVSGDLRALRDGNDGHVLIELDDTKPAIVAKSLAYALVQRSWATDDLIYADLEDDEFRTLVNALIDVAKTNRRVFRTGTPLAKEYKATLDILSPLAEEFPEWHELSFFAGTVAESAGELSKAVGFFQKALETAPDLPSKSKIGAEIENLEKILRGSQLSDPETAKKQIDEYVRFATGVFNTKFSKKKAAPEVVLTEEKQSYWDGKKITTNPVIALIPDVAYREAAWPFITEANRLVDANQHSEAGAMVQSYVDILTSFAKQNKAGQTAQDADWVIAEGAIAWLFGEPEQIKTDRRPLRSLKAPGTAYEGDVQISEYDEQSSRARDPFVLSGIPNKAFFELSMRMGTDKALEIWSKGFSQFSADVTIPMAARSIGQIAKEQFGEQSDEMRFVRDAWKIVGIEL